MFYIESVAFFLFLNGLFRSGGDGVSGWTAEVLDVAWLMALCLVDGAGRAFLEDSGSLEKLGEDTQAGEPEHACERVGACVSACQPGAC